MNGNTQFTPSSDFQPKSRWEWFCLIAYFVFVFVVLCLAVAILTPVVLWFVLLVIKGILILRTEHSTQWLYDWWDYWLI